MTASADPAAALAAKILADCGGDEALARLTLAHLLLNARRGLSPGFLRLGPPERPAGD